MRSAACLALVATAAIVLAGPAHAQTARSGGAPNAQLMLQMQQLASERTALQAENARGERFFRSPLQLVRRVHVTDTDMLRQWIRQRARAIASQPPASAGATAGATTGA